MTTPNYSYDRLLERAAAAKLAKAEYLADLELRYRGRKEQRAAQGVPSVAYCGMGRAGKDTSAEYVCGKLGLIYPKSSSWMVLPLIAHMIGVPEAQAWEERHQNREFWIEACEAVRHGDITLLARLCLGAGDVMVGPRGLEEFRALAAEVVDWTVWIDNPRVAKDPTVKFTAGDCDLMIPNHGTLEALHEKLDKVMPALYGRR